LRPKKKEVAQAISFVASQPTLNKLCVGPGWTEKLFWIEILMLYIFVFNHNQWHLIF
jgi:hypothetical protein